MSVKLAPAPIFVHLFADFAGASEPQLGDAALLSGLLIAAASGAGLAALGPPVVRQLPSGELGGVLLLERCHIAAHTVPARGTLLVDVLVPQLSEARKVVEVFARRFSMAKMRVEHTARG